MVLTGSSRYTLFVIMILWTSSFLLQVQVAMSVPFQISDTLNVARNDVYGVEPGFQRSRVAARTPGELQVPIDLWIERPTATWTYCQHWSLVIDTKYAFAAEVEVLAAPLTVKSFTYHSDKIHKLTSLDCHAKFKDQAELNRVLKELGSMKMTLMPSHKGENIHEGGTCMHYVWDALEHLKKGGHIPNIPKKFEEIYDRDYQKVKDEVWGK